MIQIKNNIVGFSLIEIMIGILIVSIITITGFQTLTAIGVGKIKIIEKTRIEKEAYFASEKLFEMIKKGGQIDYEEYWNRYSYNTSYSSGYFDSPSGFGNFGISGSIGTTSYGNAPYNCRSSLGLSMGSNGCIISGPQRYKEYSQQFIDRNSDADGDGGDEDGDGSIVDDADDAYLGIGPEAFPIGSSGVGELYLINLAGDERTLFRWNVNIDSDAPATATCTGTQNITGEACLGTIEFLKLTGKDYGYDHDNSGPQDIDGSQGDGIIDTWMIHDDFLPDTTPVVAGSNNDNYWQAIFPNNIHVSNVGFYIYPNKDLEYSWRDTDVALQIAPYLQIKMTLQSSWKEKRKIRGVTPQVQINTTIQLSNLDLQ